MPTIVDPPPGPRRRPTLARMMGTIALTAVLLAVFHPYVSAALAIILWGVFLVDAMRLPIINDGDGPQRWVPWVVWHLALLVCPIAIHIVAVLYPYSGVTGSPHLWASLVVERLFLAQMAVSVVAAVAAAMLTRGIGRLSAWGWIALMAMITLFAFLEANTPFALISL